MAWYQRFTEGPWRLLLGLSTAILVLGYILVAFLTIWHAPADFSLPLKLSFFFTLLLLMLTLVDDLREAVAKRSVQVIPRSYSLVITLVGFLVIAAPILAFFKGALIPPAPNLSLLIKVVITVGLVPPFLFSIVEFYRAAELFIRRFQRGRARQ